MNNILLVCVGNICRSPLAEVELARQMPERKVWSAGLSALVGQGADPMSIEVAQRNQLDLGAHVAQQLTSWMCQHADLILVMEQSNKVWLEQQFPFARGKVFRLGHFGTFDVADPYRQPRLAFEQAWGAIERGVADWVPRIRQLG